MRSEHVDIRMLLICSLAVVSRAWPKSGYVDMQSALPTTHEQDLRDREPAFKKHFKSSIAITSIALHPDNQFHFVIGQETGSILRYDTRSPMKVLGRIWGAHGNRPVADLKWKSGNDGGWLASAGADRTVQVSRVLWNIRFACS
jgi:WD40 repeat protein